MTPAATETPRLCVVSAPMDRPAPASAPPPSLSDMETFLFGRARSGMKLGLDRMQAALEALGHPERTAPAFHVAGTNGKGSVSAFLERILSESGLRTGLYTSPHLERLSERFRIDGEPIAPALLASRFDELRRQLPDAFADGPDGLTFFELVTLLGLFALAKAKTDVQVIEVGLGGRLDATNVISPELCCLTPIGFDHKEFLGDTLAAIASEKAGIIKPGTTVVCARQPPEALRVIETIARERRAPLSLEGRDFELVDSGRTLTYRSERGTIDGIELGLRGLHQHSNAAVAIRAIELSRPGIDRNSIRAGLSRTRWPGRLETVRTNPQLLLDGAHNPHAAIALAESMTRLFAHRRITLVLGLLADKEAAPMLDALLPIAHEVVVTEPPSPRALSAAVLAQEVRARHPRVTQEPDPSRAVDLAVDRAQADDVILVCGSLYIVGTISAHLHGREAGGPSEVLK